MKTRCVFITLAILALSGCSSPERKAVEDLDWQPTNIDSKAQCPDLAGRYMNNREYGFSPLYAGKNLERHSDEKGKLRRDGKPLPPKFGWEGVQTEASASDGVLFKDDESRAAYFSRLVFSISMEQDFLIQKTNMLGQQYVTPMNTAMAGCNQGAVILRNLNLTSTGDLAPMFVLYGELEIRKLPDGDLQVIQRRRRRTVSAVSGLLGAAQESPAVINVYPLLR